MTVLVIDYGIGNLGSVRRALEECGADVRISDNPADLKQASRMVLPGVGAFADGMRSLNEHGWAPAIRQAVLEDRVPMLGICLGMQLMMSEGSEGGQSMPGLGLIPGQVRRMEPSNEHERIPHVGWNEVVIQQPNDLLADICDGTDFYFVHSFCVEPESSDYVVSLTPYAGGFPSVIAHEFVYGVQFHPEKSSKAGFRLLQNFLEAC